MWQRAFSHKNIENFYYQSKKDEYINQKGDGKCGFLSFSVMIRYIRKNIRECESEAGIFMDITMLGTGNAMVTECYNTCFVLRDGDRHLLVDGGGGNTLLAQLKHAGFDWMDMREIFVTHKHVDHIMGIVWMIRMICQHMKQGQYEGEATIYGHEEVIRILEEMAEMLYPKKPAISETACIW
mgnify:CR=1 FL=1